MTREETLAAYKACMIILTRRSEDVKMRDTHTENYQEMVNNMRHNQKVMTAIVAINKALDLSPLDMSMLSELKKMNDEKACLVLAAMDNITALKAYLAMLIACHALGMPTSEQIEWFDLYGKMHNVTYKKLKDAIDKR